MKVAIMATLRSLIKIPLSQRTWENIKATMLQSSTLEADNDEIYRSDKYIVPSKTRRFQLERGRNPATVEAVCILHFASHWLSLIYFTGQGVVSDSSQR